MNHLITIIVPVYNVEKYLKRCLDSILKQTYSEFELIIVNDGSEDNSGKICDEYRIIDSRVKVIHKANGGLSDARNVGINSAKGKYITFIDSDDWVADKYLEVLYNLTLTYNAEISICDHLKTSVEKLFIVSSGVETILKTSNLQALEELYGPKAVVFTVAWGKLYDIRLFKEVRFPVGKIHEDEFIQHKLIYASNTIVYTNSKLIYYYQRNDSITGNKENIKNKLDAIEAFEERGEFLKKLKIENLFVKNLIVLYFLYKSVTSKLNKFTYEERVLIKSKYKILKHVIRKSKIPIYKKFFIEVSDLIPFLSYLILKYKVMIKNRI
jgi:glycosyltransferase involved in cell wall biosynthesis